MDFHPFDGIVDDPRSIMTLTTETLVIGSIGIILGTIVDKQFTALSKKHTRYATLITFLQILFSGFLVAVLYMYSPTAEFIAHFQRTLPGMAFPAMFYGVQSNIFNSWQALKIPTVF